MTERRETVLLTGASGLIGRHLIEVLKDDYTIYALARRTQTEAEVPFHPHVHWLIGDITNDEDLARTFRQIPAAAGTLDFVVHLAAYYDFASQKYTDLYERTNVTATRRILEFCREQGVRRFVFASSLVASEFPPPGSRLEETSSLNAVFPYALTKRRGEELTREYSVHFPCTVVRLAAVFSDWCEYEPLYHMMRIWLSNRWDARVFVGRKGMAIPYVHISCVTHIFRTVLQQSDRLKPFDTFLVSRHRPTSLLEIFRNANRLFRGAPREPIRVPVPLAAAGGFMRDILGRMLGARPFERRWMLRYVDRECPTDCSYTRLSLGWRPKERYRLENRLLHLIENLKALPEEWHRRNLSRLRRFGTGRASLTLVQSMYARHEQVVEEILRVITSPENADVYPYYQKLDRDRLRYFVDRNYGNLFTSVRHGDRSVMIGFAHDLARARYNEGVGVTELCRALNEAGAIIARRLCEHTGGEDMRQLVHDKIELATQLAVDEIEDTYDQLAHFDGCVMTPGN